MSVYNDIAVNEISGSDSLISSRLAVTHILQGVSHGDTEHVWKSILSCLVPCQWRSINPVVLTFRCGNASVSIIFCSLIQLIISHGDQGHVWESRADNEYILRDGCDEKKSFLSEFTDLALMELISLSDLELLEH